MDLMTVNNKFIPITHEELYYGVDDLIELSALCSSERQLPTDLHEVYKCLMPYYVLEQFLITALPQCKQVVEPTKT